LALRAYQKVVGLILLSRIKLTTLLALQGKGFRNETFDFSIAEILGGWAQSANQRVSGRNLEFQLC
jgi:hypothetical protein